MFTTSYTVVFLPIMLYVNVYGKMYPTHPEVGLSFEEKIKKHGYPVEIHEVITEDDYILSLYHIPHGLKNPEYQKESKSIVVIIHGLGSSPGAFNILGREKSSTYYFADRGFDTWVFCARGVAGSLKRKHKKWDWNEDDEYWYFSLHEISVYDLTATIDYILMKTKQSELFLIGHSAGGNEIFAMLSERPEYNSKVKMAVSWAGSPILKRFDYPLLVFIVGLIDLWKGIIKYLGMAEFFPHGQLFKPTFRALCAHPNWKSVCIKASWIIGSHESVLQHPDDIEIIADLTPPRSSSQQGLHFLDNLNTGEFRKYDYGPKKNMHLYGQKIPPKYNLSACTVPTVFFVGRRDAFVVKEDIYESAQQLRNVVMVYEIQHKKFTHTDFIFARNADELVYEPTYKILKDFDEGRIPPRLTVPDEID